MIVSAAGAEVVEPIGEMLGVDRVVATRMVVEDGRYTGEIEFYAYGREQGGGDPRAGRGSAATTSADCYAYSDSITDLPMLEAVGHPVAVNPDRALRRAALERGWPVREFSRPVPLTARFAVPPAPVVTGAAVGVGAAVAGLAWYARRRALRTVGPVTGLTATGLPATPARWWRRGA